MNRFGIGVATALAMCAASALTACSRVPDVVKISVGQPLSGPLAHEGQDLLHGVELAVLADQTVAVIQAAKRAIPVRRSLDDKTTDFTDSAPIRSTERTTPTTPCTWWPTHSVATARSTRANCSSV